MIKIYNSKDERFRKKPINLCQRKEFGCKLFRFKKKEKKKIKREKRKYLEFKKICREGEGDVRNEDTWLYWRITFISSSLTSFLAG